MHYVTLKLQHNFSRLFIAKRPYEPRLAFPGLGCTAESCSGHVDQSRPGPVLGPLTSHFRTVVECVMQALINMSDPGGRHDPKNRTCSQLHVLRLPLVIAARDRLEPVGRSL
jgi:hypothetical protein